MNAKAKSRQFCSVCKEWLEMEIVPTSDGDEDDGVIWYRCPQCQGFLPKLRGRDEAEEDRSTEAASLEAKDEPQESGDEVSADPESLVDDTMPWDSPAAMMEALKDKEGADPASLLEEDDDDPLLGVAQVEEAGQGPTPSVVGASTRGSDLALDEDLPSDLPDLEGPDDISDDDDEESSEDGDDGGDEVEPLHEYAAQLAAIDPEDALSYRPWGTYEVGQCIHHLAWDDCGVVVAKETLPGKRQVIKVYFEEAGVVRLIEQASR